MTTTPIKSITDEKMEEWPALKKEIWRVITGENLNAKYVNAWELTEKLFAVIPDPAIADAVSNELDASEEENAEWEGSFNACNKALTASQERSQALQEQVKELESAMLFAHETLREINPGNYDHDDVCNLNDASVEVIVYLGSFIPKSEATQ